MRTVLHVLPHPGGGGERYVDLLSRMDGYRFERIYLAPSARKADALPAIPRSSLKLLRSAALLHSHGEVASGLCLPVVATRTSVVTFNGLHLLRRTHGARRLAIVANLKLVVRSANRAICVGEAEYDDAHAAVGRELGVRLVTIHNGVDLPAFPTQAERDAARASFELGPETLVGAVVGELSPHKDPMTAVKAALRAEAQGLPIVLLVAGEGPLRPALEEAAASSSAVRLLGYRDDVNTLLAAADLFVLSSLREGLSFALLDAMGIGLAPVVSDAPGNPDAVGECGIVVPVGDIDGFAQAFARLSDTGVRAEIGAGARDRAMRRFSADDMATATSRVYDAALSDQP
jgi:glycosyltransferase involved in cell wall biosynthesis